MSILKDIANLLDGPRNPSPPVENATRKPAPVTKGSVEGEPVRITHAEARGGAVPLTKAAQAELAVTVKPTPPRPRLDNVPFPSPSQLQRMAAAIGAERMATVISRSELEQVREIDAAWMRLNGAFANLSNTAALATYRKQLEDLADQIAKSDDATSGDSWTLQDYQSDFEIKRGVVRNKMRELEAKAAATIGPVQARFSQALTDLADSLEPELQAEAARFDAPYAAPPYVWLIRKAAVVALENRSGVGRPLTMLRFLPVPDLPQND